MEHRASERADLDDVMGAEIRPTWVALYRAARLAAAHDLALEVT